MIPSPNPPSKGELTRQAILAAAYPLFLEQGYHATSMRQVASRAGIAVSAIYNHFAAKQDIFSALIFDRHPYQHVLPILQRAPGSTLEEFAHNAARAMLTELENRPDFLKLIFIEIIEFQGAHMPSLFQTVYPQVLNLVSRFDTWDDRTRGLPAPIIIRTFIGFIFSYFISQYMTGPITGPARKDADDMHTVVDIFLHGILKPGEQQ